MATVVELISLFSDQRHRYLKYVTNQLSIDANAALLYQFDIPEDFKLAWLRRYVLHMTTVATINEDALSANWLSISRGGITYLDFVPNITTGNFGLQHALLEGQGAPPTDVLMIWEWPSPIPVEPGDTVSVLTVNIDTNGTPTYNIGVAEFALHVIDY